MVERNNFPGGIGLSPALFDLEKEFLRHGLTTIKVCPCQEGCPSCYRSWWQKSGSPCS